ncbi:MAG TPA: LysE family transporter [Chitinophagaceae bacterium]|nr:LysE family transporter [Chitinophagaceae bacterium]
MRPLVKVFFTGVLVSFLGELPLGTFNVAAMQIAISEGLFTAMLFALGAIVIEIVYVRISLLAFNWIRKKGMLLRILNYVTVVILLTLAISSFYAAMQPGEQKSIVLSTKIPKFLLGASMCLASPAPIPFWLGWTTVLFSKKILLPRNDHYNVFTVGIALGTFAGSCVFIFGGLLIAEKIKNNEHILHWIIGGIFLATAIFQIWRIVKKKDSAEKIIHPDQKLLQLEKEMEEYKKHSKDRR